MSEYFWCHGPSCHQYSTQDRIRGNKGSKVLRTRKIKQHHNEYYNVNRAWNYFCSNTCQSDFWNEYGNAIRQIAPRHEPLETKIEDPIKEKHTTSYGHTYYTHTINKIDNDNNVG